MSAWIYLLLERTVDRADSAIFRMHLRTDPKCNRHRKARPGSRLARATEGRTCVPCLRSHTYNAPYDGIQA